MHHFNDEKCVFIICAGWFEEVADTGAGREGGSRRRPRTDGRPLAAPVARKIAIIGVLVMKSERISGFGMHGETDLVEL